MNPYQIELYRLDTIGSSLEKLDEIEGYAKLEFNKRLNNFGVCQFSIDPRHKKATTENLRRWVNHIAIKKNGTIVWGGPMTKLDLKYGTGVKGTLDIEAREHFYHLFFRYTDALSEFTGVDAGTIAWNLINTVQSRDNGELMISQGTIETTTTRDRSYEYANVGEKIMGLSEVRLGFDFGFEYTTDSNGLWDGVDFNVYKNKGAYRQGLPTLRIGENVTKVEAITKSTMVNTVTFLGAGTGSEVPISPSEDTNVQAAYTRREDVIKEADVVLQDTLDEISQRYLDYNKVELYDVDVQLEPVNDLSFGTFEVGDMLDVDLKAYNSAGALTLVNFEGKTRILEINVDIDQNGGEVVTPTISQII